MSQIKLFVFVAVLSLLQQADAQQSCINTCTDSANVLTQLKSCSGCGTDDWACLCRCQQYMDAVISCVQQNCDGSDIENNIVSFCSSQGVSISVSSGSVSIGSTTASTSSTSSSATTPTTLSTTGTVTDGRPFLSSAIAGSSFTATDSSDISLYLATAIPSSARTESSDACFVNSPYNYYSTPTWYSTLPTQAQSYYSSVNQGNTAACTLSSAAAAALAGSQNSGHHGLSGGAIAGIVVGAVVAALLLALLLCCLCLRRRKHARRDAEAARARAYKSGNMPPGTYGNEKGLNGGAVPISNGRAPYGNERGLAGVAVPGQARQAPYYDGGGMAGAVPTSNGRAPYGNESGLAGAAIPASNGRTSYGNERGLTGAAVPDQTRPAPYNDGNGLVGGAPVTNGRAVQAPYENGGSNGLGAGGGTASGAGQQNPNWSHTTTTTMRTTIRPRRKDAPVS